MAIDPGQPCLFEMSAGPPGAHGDAHATLLAAIADHLDAGLIVPCIAHDAQDSPWTADSPALADEAAVACHGCPALVECRAYAVAAREAAGVWGGLTAGERIVRPRRRPTSVDPFPGTTRRSRAIHENRSNAA